MKLGYLAVLTATLALADAASAVGFFDGTFNDQDWSTTKLIDTTVPGDATGFSSQVLSGGNPGAVRQTTHDWTIKPAGVSILFAHVNASFVYTPSSGPIDALQVGFDYRLPSSIFHVNTIGYGALLVQDGSYYTLGGAALIAPEPWTPFSFDGTNPSDWNEVGGAGAPDFTAAGKPMTFGYYTSNGGSGASYNLTAIGQIDNFEVTVTPEPGSLALLGLAGLTAVRRRSAIRR